MKIAAIKERAKGETRVAITPETAKLFAKNGYSVFVEKDIGTACGFTNEEYAEAGATLSAVPLEILSDADYILKVQPSPLDDKINEIALSKKEACVIGLLSPHSNHEYFTAAANKKLSLIAMELVPRTTIAQSMDTLSSQSNLAGYRAVLEAAYYFDRGFPMMMTAAGTVNPAKVLVLGAGVAGLQAIATARRLGAAVSAYDVRAATKEQVESLGAKFIYPGTISGDAEGTGGYAKEVTKEFAEIQKQFLHENAPKFDIIIATAQIPGKAAPKLLSKEDVQAMKPGSVIVDMATSSGGNVVDSVIDKVIARKGVKIIGWANLATKIAYDASRLYAKNLYNFMNYAVDKELSIKFDNELVEEMLLSRNGQSLNKKFDMKK